MAIYIAVVHKEKSSEYGISFPDLPGCISAGDTLEEARLAAEEALALHVQGMIEEGQTLPEPRALDAIVRAAESEDAELFLGIEARSEESVRINITVPSSAIQLIDLAVEKLGASRSGFMAQAALREARELLSKG